MEISFRLNICNERGQDHAHFVCQLCHHNLNGMAGKLPPWPRVVVLSTSWRLEIYPVILKLVSSHMPSLGLEELSNL